MKNKNKIMRKRCMEWWVLDKHCFHDKVFEQKYKTSGHGRFNSVEKIWVVIKQCCKCPRKKVEYNFGFGIPYDLSESKRIKEVR